MALSIDYILDDELDLIIDTNTGDFKRTVFEQCDQQAASLIILTEIGGWREHPLCGFGIDKYKNSSGAQQTMKRDMIVQLTADGITVNSLIVKNGSEFYLDAQRN